MFPFCQFPLIIWYKASLGVSDVLVKNDQIRPEKAAAISTSESILISILYLIGLISWPKSHMKRRGRPYVYPPTVILRCFVVRIWLRLDSNRALCDFLAMDCYPYNRRIMKAQGSLLSLEPSNSFCHIDLQMVIKYSHYRYCNN